MNAQQPSGWRRLMRRLVPAGLRAPLGRAGLVLHNRRRARRVLRAYTTHYALSRRRYRADGHAGTPPLPPATLGVRVLGAHRPDNVLPLPPAHDVLVGRLAADVRARLARTADCRLFPPPATTSLPPRTDDVPEVRRGQVVTAQLARWQDLDGLEGFCEAWLPAIEQAVFGAYALVDKVYVYRTLVSRQPLRSSFLWHYDEHPPEVIKLLVYLSDVTEGTAPFTYLAGPDGHAVTGTRNPLHGASRIPESVMQAHLQRGCATHAVTGPAGTVILFNDNVVHRATLAERGPRDVLVLQLRPATTKLRPYVDVRWTGSFPHRDFNRNPTMVAPEPWSLPAPSVVATAEAR